MTDEVQAVDTITHREMRNSSAEVLRRVEAGESFIVTNHGQPVALLSPAPAVGHAGRYEALLQSGELVPPTSRDGWDSVPAPRPLSGPPSDELLRQLRGAR